jgi:hypothetical protein
MTRAARITSAEVQHAKSVAEANGLRLAGLEKKPDGTVRLEFGEWDNDWRAGSPLYSVK